MNMLRLIYELKLRLTMPTVTKKVKFYKCNRCDYEWYPRSKEKPKTCPSCRNPYWDSQRKNKSTGTTLKEGL